MKISNEVLDVLKRCTVKGNKVFLPEQLPRPLYVAVNKVLEVLGGKWTRAAKAHVFLDDPNEVFGMAVLTGEVTDPKKVFQFFPTPPEIANQVVDMAEISAGLRILEPSAGNGALARALPNVVRDLVLVELDPKHDQKLEMYGEVYGTDFLKLTEETLGLFDRVIMNPPFTRLQDVDHVLHAHRFLKPGGILVAIMSPGWTFRQDRKSVAFREWLEAQPEVEKHDLPEGAFKASGTMISTILVKMRK